MKKLPPGIHFGCLNVNHHPINNEEIHVELHETMDKLTAAEKLLEMAERTIRNHECEFPDVLLEVAEAIQKYRETK